MMSDSPSADIAALWQCDASELCARFASGAATPEMALESVLSRIDGVDAKINAFVFLDIDRAREAARAATRRWQAGAPLSKLDGIPVAIKDNIFVHGMFATWGSLLYRQFEPQCDDLPVTALTRAGCIVLGKTNTPELSMAGHTDNRVFGSTGNPRDLDLTPGGSSGGSVAAVAAGMCPIALGTDAGGSIRKPAGQTGILGLKPGIGSVPRRYGFPPLAHDVQVIGPFARSVADLTAVFGVIAERIPSVASPRPLRIGAFACFPDDPIGQHIDTKVSSAFDEGLRIMRSLGHQVSLIAPFWQPTTARDIFNNLVNVGVARVVKDFPDWQQSVTPAVLAMAKAGSGVDATRYVELIERLTAFRWHLREAVSQFDVVITPVTPTIGWPRSEAAPKTIGGEPTRAGAVGAFTAGVSLAGLPALSIPGPADRHGPPIGLQLIASMGGEPLLLSLAASYELAAPWPALALAIR